jgi:hypothetical protein
LLEHHLTQFGELTFEVRIANLQIDQTPFHRLFIHRPRGR